MTCKIDRRDYADIRTSKKIRITRIPNQEFLVVIYCVEGRTGQDADVETMLPNSVILDKKGNRFIAQDLKYRTRIDDIKILATRFFEPRDVYTLVSKKPVVITIADFTYEI